MEKEGLVKGINYFEQNGVPISQNVTDRHLQVDKWLQKNLSETTYILMSGTLLVTKNYFSTKTNYRYVLIEEYYLSMNCQSK